MSYQSFLSVLSQFSGNNQANLIMEGNTITIEKNENSWILSSRVFAAYGEEIPDSIKESLSCFGSFRWQQKGAYLHLHPDSQDMFLMQEVSPLSGYLCFKKVLQDFALVANEWKELLARDTFARIRRSL